MVGGQGAPGFADQVRMGNAMAIAFGLEYVHDIVGVLVHAVVHGAAAAGASALVVYAQATADIHGAHGGAHLTQLAVKAGAFPEPGLDIPDIGDLGAKVEMQQLQGMERSCVTQCVDDIQHLAGRQAEFGLLTTRVLPVAFADGRKVARAPRSAAIRRGAPLPPGSVAVPTFLNDDEHPVAQGLANQGQANILPILVAVADDHRSWLL